MRRRSRRPTPPLALVVGRASSGLRTRPSIAHGFDAYAPVMQVLALRVAWLLRRHWRATLAFARRRPGRGLSMAAGVGAAPSTSSPSSSPRRTGRS